ncbi:MAG TPA: hypothetical protein VFN64_07945 [Burkholderiaceae bacterium]|nr:hypothetical protein [Burkholderiaceae bacterium]
MIKVSTPEPSSRSHQAGCSAFALSGVVLAVLLAMAAPDTHAAGFGEVQDASQLGERLYARVPLVGEGTADVATECVRLIPESVLQDAPALNNARIGIDRRSSPPAVVVSTLAPVMEPAVRFVLEMGCGNRFRREFVLLIDPPDLPAVQTAATQGTVVPPAARVVPTDEPRWGSSTMGGSTAPVQSASAPVYDPPLAEPPVKAAPAPRKAAPKPRPKPAARAQVAAQPQPASAPPPEPPKASTTDRLVLADTDPAAASPPAPTPEQAARDARAEALNKQVEALTKEVARMREDMDKLSARNRELVKEAESRTGWFAAAGLGIVIAGVVLGMMGRREKKVSWRDNLAQAGDDGEASFAPASPVRPETREDVPAPKPVVTPVQSYYRDTGVDPVTDLDVTKLDVRESTGLHGTIMNTTVAAGTTTMFPSDIVAGTTLGPSSKSSPLQSLDFSLDDFDTPSTRGRAASPVFKPGKPASNEVSEAARASLFEEIEKVHQASKKA